MRRPGDEKPSAEESANLRAWLQAHGAKARDLGKVLPAGKARREVSDSLCAWLKARPRAG